MPKRFVIRSTTTIGTAEEFHGARFPWLRRPRPAPNPTHVEHPLRATVLLSGPLPIPRGHRARLLLDVGLASGPLLVASWRADDGPWSWSSPDRSAFPATVTA